MGPIAPFKPYPWQPVQSRVHTDTGDDVAPYFQGTYVDTLSVDMNCHGAEAHSLRLGQGVESLHSWEITSSLVAENLVVCKGIALVACAPRFDPRSGWNFRIGKLPRTMRPEQALHFAAVSKQAETIAGHQSSNSHLLHVIVGPDGWLYGMGLKDTHGAIDMSGIRFCIGRSMSLTDNVKLYSCEINNKRFISLQGDLNDRCYSNFSSKALMSLVPACRPPRELNFIVVGHRAGCFHLLRLKPSCRADLPNDLFWLDSLWNTDKIHCTGVFYEVAKEALEYSVMGQQWSTEHSRVFLRDFQAQLIRCFGSIDEAWTNWFDLDGSGDINFTEFCGGCKKAGYVGNPMRLWVLLDEDGSGDISLEELKDGTDTLEVDSHAKRRVATGTRQVTSR